MRSLVTLVACVVLLSGCASEGNEGTEGAATETTPSQAPPETPSAFPPCEKKSGDDTNAKIMIAECAVGYAAIAEEMVFTSTSRYTDDEVALQKAFASTGGEIPGSVALLAIADEDSYCVQGLHRDLQPRYTVHFDSTKARLQRGPCT